MNRWTAAIVFCVSLAAIAPAEDKVTYRNRKTGAKEEIKGSIDSESVQGIKIKEQLISGADILEVEYAPPFGLTGPQMRAPFNREAELAKLVEPTARSAKIDETVAAYGTLIDGLKQADGPRAYIEFRLALFLMHLAEAEPTRTDDARKALSAFKDKEKNRDTWEYVSVMQMLARIQESQGKYDDARKTFEELAGRKELPPEARGQANFALVRMLLRGEQLDLAKTRIDALEEIIKDGPDAVRLQVYRIELRMKKGEPGDAEKQLKAVLAGPADDVKGHAANVLGDFYLSDKRPEDAMWQYLWVDVIYNKDPDEHARALFHLTKLFKEVRNDDALVEKTREKLRDPQFAGSEYQRRAGVQEKGSK
jgi:tetratricopeptide (TPR) repeat protein